MLTQIYDLSGKIPRQTHRRGKFYVMLILEMKETNSGSTYFYVNLDITLN